MIGTVTWIRWIAEEDYCCRPATMKMVLLRVGAAVARWETGLVLIDAGGDLSASAAGVGASVMIGKVEAH